MTRIAWHGAGTGHMGQGQARVLSPEPSAPQDG